VKLAVFYPWSSPFCWTGWADHLPNLQRPAGYEVRFFRGKGWCPARRHIDGCEQALAWGADLILVIGADQIHPDDMLVKLIDRWEAKRQVITAMVPARGYVGWQDMKPFQPMAWRFKRTNSDDILSITSRQYRGMKMDADAIEVIDPKDGDFQRINFIGSGVLMFHRDHLLALKTPWFMESIDPETYQRIANMDCVFVWRLQREAGAQVWCDTTIKVKHLHAFEIDESYGERFADWMRPGEGPPDICKYAAPPGLSTLQPQTAVA
jgi:hypothetical protein